MRIQGALAAPRRPNSLGDAVPAASEGEVLERRALPSGRSLLVLAGADASEAIEVHSPQGELEIRIVCGPEGPVVSLRSARVELEAPTVAIRCEDLDVRAAQRMALQAGTVGIRSEGEVQIAAERDVHINGHFVRLNCTEAPSSSPPAT